MTVSTILVLGSERLYSTMTKSYDNKPTSNAAAAASDERISVIKLAKSGGCVDRDAAFMKSLRESQIRSYFFGNPIQSSASSTLSLSITSSNTSVTLSPHAQQLDFDSLSIYNIIAPTDDDDDYDPSNFSTNDSFLPGGVHDRDTTPNPPPPQPPLDDSATAKPSSSSSLFPSNLTNPATSPPLKKLTSTPHNHPPLALQNTLLAITHAAPNAPLIEIRDASIIGFVYVADVDEKKGKIRVLAPMGGRVPPRAIVWGRKWPGETVGLIG
jgi:polyribonucleotide 5'-hydroxyl-kinase